MNAPSRVTLVSGGSRGLGAALVKECLDRGDTVAVFSRSPSPFTESLRSDPATSDRFHWQAVDAADAAAVDAFALDVRRRYGRIDTLINNAGIAVEGLLTTSSQAEIRHALALNLESVIVLSRACLKGMLAARSGCIINVSSVNAIRGHSGLSVYSATKAALIGLTQSLAREVGPAGIRVNAIAPGFFESDMVQHMSEQQRARIVRRTPLGKLCTIDDLIGCARFLMDCQGITGQTLVVDGGFSS